jgi:hypothetical protein
MATLLKVLNNLADIKSAGGVALRARTQAELCAHKAVKARPSAGCHRDLSPAGRLCRREERKLLRLARRCERAES